MFSFFSITSLAQSIAMDETAYFQCSANSYSTLGLQSVYFVLCRLDEYTVHCARADWFPSGEVKKSVLVKLVFNAKSV